MTTESALSIGEAAQRTGLSIDTLRFYEREGLLASPVERVSGRRVYSEQQVEWLALCRVLRTSGMPLRAIRDYAELMDRGEGTEPRRLELLREHQDRVAGQMRDLSRCLDLIGHKVGVYEDLAADGQSHHACRAPRPPGRAE